MSDQLQAGRGSKEEDSKLKTSEDGNGGGYGTSSNGGGTDTDDDGLNKQQKARIYTVSRFVIKNRQTLFLVAIS